MSKKKSTAQQRSRNFFIVTYLNEKQIKKVTTFIINSNYSRKPKSLEMLNYIKE